MKVNFDSLAPSFAASRLRSFCMSVITFLFITVFGGFLKAQGNIECQQWAIEICAEPASLPSPCPDNINCGRAYWYVYLINNGNQISQVNFEFKSLSFSGIMQVNSINPNTGNNILSTLDAAASFACSPPETNNPAALVTGDPVVTIDENARTFALSAGKSNGTSTTWSFTRRRLLFVVAANLFPWEAMEPASVKGVFELIKMDGTPVTCPINGFQSCANGIQKFGPAIQSCGFDKPTLKIGSGESMATPEYPNRKKYPIWMFFQNTQTFSVAQLDFLMQIMANKSLAGISILPGLFTTQDVLLYGIPANSMTNLRTYAKRKNFSVTAGPTQNAQNTLYWIVVNGPVLASDCLQLTIDFIREPLGIADRRIQMSNDFTCCGPLIGPKNEETIGATSTNGSCLYTTCPGNVTVEVKKPASLPPTADACQDLFFEVWLKSSLENVYDFVEVAVDVVYSGQLSNFQAPSILPPGVTMTAVAITVPSPPLVNFGKIRVTLTYNSNGLTTNTTPLRLALAGLRSAQKQACIHEIRFHDAVFKELQAAQGAFCLPSQITSGVTGASTTDDYCLQSLTLSYAMWDGKKTTEVDYKLNSTFPNGTNCLIQGFSPESNMGLCPCATLNSQTITPTKNNPVINGVDGADITKISLHVLGLESFNSPYKRIAADVNQSNTITPLDRVDIQKLILGTINNFICYNGGGDCPSFRFVEDSYMFPNPEIPWMPAFPETYSFTFPPSATAKFKVVKIGDVNQSYVAPSFTEDKVEDRSVLSLGISIPENKARGESMEIPVFVREEASFATMHAAFVYDPAKLTIKSVRWADELYQNPNLLGPSWNVVKPGELRVLWTHVMAENVQLKKGAPLLFITAEANSPILADAELFQLSEQDISCSMFSREGQTTAFNLTTVRGYKPPVQEKKAGAEAVEPEWSMSIYPNPAHSAFRLEIELPSACEARLEVFDLTGRNIIQQEIPLKAGGNVIISTQLPVLQAGQYMIQVETPWGRQTQRLVKQE